MDFNCIEALPGPPEFRVIDQMLGPKQLDLHLERRDTSIVCPPTPDVLFPCAGEPASLHP